MNKKYKLILIFNILFLISFNIYAEAPEYELPTEYVMEFPFAGGDFSFLDYMNGDIFITWGTKTYRIDPIEKTLYEYDKKNELWKILGRKGERFIVSRQKHETMAWYTDENAYMDLFLYDPQTEKYEQLEKIKGGTASTDVLNIFYYYNDIYLATRDNDESYKYVSINASTGEETRKGAGIFGITPDKMHAFIRYPYIINLSTEKKIGEYKLGSKRYFISNDLFITDNLGELDVCDLSGEVKATFNYSVPTGDFDYDKYESSSFMKIMNSEYGISHYSINRKVHMIIVKTPNEMDYLDSLGLLFQPTTAVLNDDRVRMREWPLLNAKHLAFLEKDEKVEVLDRSGIKVKIGDMEDYWYKIQRADGQIGWSYGVFLDISEEE